MLPRISLFVVCLAILLGVCSGCGGGNAATTGTISQLVVTPSTLSLNEGQVTSVAVVAVDATGATLTTQPTFTYSSSDASAVTVSTAGLVCAGVWDSGFVVCRPGQIPSGTVNIIVSAPGSTTGTTVSASVPVSIHLQIDRIDLSAPAVACVSQNQSLQFTAKAISTGVDITSEVASFNWTSATPAVGPVGPTTGLAVAHSPGISNITASAAGTTSAPLAFVVCPPASIQLTPTAALSMNKGDSVTLQAAVIDTMGNAVDGATLNYSSSATAVARATTAVGSVTVSALTAGSFDIVASCTPPNCNSAPSGTITTPIGAKTAQQLGFGFPLYSNVVPGTAAGTTTTNVFVTGPTVLGGTTANHQLEVFNSTTLTAVTVVPLPNVANSMLFDPQGQKLYIGSDAGLMILDPNSNTVSLFTGTVSGDPNITTVTGKVLAVSPDSMNVIVSDVTNGLVFVVNNAASAQVFHAAGVRAAAFSPDGFKALLGGEGGVYDFTVTLHSIASGVGTSTSSVAYLYEGSAAYISGTTVHAYATCDSQQIGTANIAAGPLVTLQGLVDPRVIGANTSQWVDLSPSITGSSCPPGISTGITSVNVAPACTPGAVVALPNGSKVFGAELDPTACSTAGQLPVYNVGAQTAASVPLTTVGTPLGVDVTPDSQQLYVGVLNGSAATLDYVDPVAGADKLQVSVPFVPTFVAVWPK